VPIQYVTLVQRVLTGVPLILVGSTHWRRAKNKFRTKSVSSLRERRRTRMTVHRRIANSTPHRTAHESNAPPSGVDSQRLRTYSHNEQWCAASSIWKGTMAMVPDAGRRRPVTPPGSPPSSTAATPESSRSASPRVRMASHQHRVLIYVTCYNVIDGYVYLLFDVKEPRPCSDWCPLQRHFDHS
jgi:hypothetical protein